MRRIPGRKQVGALIDEQLYRQAKALAIMQGRTTGAVIDDALRQYLAAQQAAPAKKANVYKRTK